jgi:hypothetical protein
MPRFTSAKFALLLMLGGAAACGDGGTPLGPDAAPRAPGGPSATIFDGAHAAGPDAKFYFLPPMVRNPHDDPKEADATLSPIVEVCELTAANVCGRLIDRYGPNGGMKTSENVRWLGNHYSVNFQAGAYTLDVTRRLRVTVLVDSLTIGWADVVVGTTARDFANVDGNEFVTITTSQTLPIKFRIDRGIARRIRLTPPLRTVTAGQTAQYAAAVVDLHSVPLNEPVTWTSSDPTVATVDANGLVTSYRPGTVTITASADGASATGTLVVTSDQPTPICSDNGLVLLGDARLLPDCGIRLTRADIWQAGAAWSSTKQAVAGGFETRFAMRMANPGPADLLVGGNTAPGADGIVFVIQNMSQTAVGLPGVGIGYGGMTSSVAVEFDTWLNGGERDPSGNHVSIHTAGIGPNGTDEAFSIAAADVPGDFYDGLVHQVVIRYVPGTMTVSLDGVVVLTAAIDLTNVGGNSILDANGKSWVGFTSGTGLAYGTHDILGWSIYTPAP